MLIINFQNIIYDMLSNEEIEYAEQLEEIEYMLIDTVLTCISDYAEAHEIDDYEPVM